MTATPNDFSELLILLVYQLINVTTNDLARQYIFYINYVEYPPI